MHISISLYVLVPVVVLEIHKVIMASIYVKDLVLRSSVRLQIMKTVYNTSIPRLVHSRNESYSARANTGIQVCIHYIT